MVLGTTGMGSGGLSHHCKKHFDGCTDIDMFVQEGEEEDEVVAVGQPKVGHVGCRCHG